MTHLRNAMSFAAVIVFANGCTVPSAGEQPSEPQPPRAPDAPTQTAPTGQVIAGQRVSIECTPQCANRQCGDDGCGGSCGTCAPETECNPLHQCAAPTMIRCAGPSGLQAGAPWPMAGHDPARTFRSGSVGPATPSLAWSIDLQTDGSDAGPVVALDGTVYVGGAQSGAPALNAIAPDSTVKWSVQTLAGSPTAATIGADGTVYFGVTGAKQTAASLYAVSPAGQVKWTLPATAAASAASDEAMTTSLSMACNGTLYFGNYITNEPSMNGVTAVNTAGQMLWNALVDSAMPPIVSPNGAIYVDAIVALRPDGTTWWSDLTTGRNMPECIGADGSIYNIYGARSPTGQWLWTLPTSLGFNTGGMAIAGDGAVYLGSAPDLIALNHDGTTRWQLTTSWSGDASTHFWKMSDLAVDGKGTIYFAIQDIHGLHSSDPPVSNLYAVDASGTLQWTFALPSDCLPRTIAIGSDRLYLNCNSIIAIDG